MVNQAAIGVAAYTPHNSFCQPSRFCQTVIPTARVVLSNETEKRKEDIWRKVAEEAAKNYGTADDAIRMNNESICVVGTKH